MQFAGDAIALGEHKREALFQAANAEAQPGQNDEAHQQNEHGNEPATLIKKRLDKKRQGGGLGAPDAISIARLDTEREGTGGKVRVERFAPGARVDPSAVVTIKAVTEGDFLRRYKA